MDLGNWATDIAGGSSYRYALITVVIAASLLGLLFQTLAARTLMEIDSAPTCHNPPGLLWSRRRLSAMMHPSDGGP